MQEICKKAKVEGFITNHSLCRTGTTKLFVKGIDRKLIKEFTGHVSDAVDVYAITSDEQHQAISNILTDSKTPSNVEIAENELQVSVSEAQGAGGVGCQCNTKKLQVHDCDKIGTMVNSLLKSRKGCKATIKIEIEFNE